MPIQAVDLFCGVGGLSCGLLQAGLNVVAGFDLDETCRYTYEHNNHIPFHQQNIRDMTGDEILNCYTPNVTQVLVGCAPCQPFSQMSIKRGEQTIREDEKYNLLLEFGRMIRRVHPTVISMENVPKIRNTDIFKEFLAILDEEGYYTDGGNVVYCPDYGIPQNRHRFVLLASNLGEIHLIPPTHNRQDVTVRPFIENLPPVEAGEICPTDPMHRTAHLSDKNLQRIRASVPGGTWKDWPEELRCECHKKDTGKTYTSVYGRMVQEDMDTPYKIEHLPYVKARYCKHSPTTMILLIRTLTFVCEM